MARRFNSRRRRRKFYKKVATRANLTREVELNRRKIRKLMYANEVKWFDRNQPSAQTSTNSWTFYDLLAGIAGGEGENQVIGQEFNAKSSYLTYQISNVQANTLGFTVRVVLFWDKQANGTLPNDSDVFTNTISPLYSKLNLANRDRFKILYDRWHYYHPNIVFDSSGVATGSQAFTMGYSKYIKLSRKVVLDNAQTAAVTNGLILAVGTPTMVDEFFFGFNHRLRFTDD